ncbi:MAG: hypothetical protein RTU63_08335 [Candidatus Thorarchaeota archaeon]
MKDLGTITMYYPFIDGDTKDVVEITMNEASSYYDFVIRLSDRVCETETSEILAYLATVHAHRLSAADVMARITQKYNASLKIRAWTPSIRKLSYEEMMSEFEHIIQSIEDDWILAEVYVQRLWNSRYLAPLIESERDIQLIEEFLQENSNLECFSSNFQTLLCDWNLLRGNLDAANECYKKTMEIAEKYDDQYQISSLISIYTSWSRTYDAQEALTLQEEGYRIAKSFDAPEFIAESKADIGRIFESLGEYDLAIQAYLESLEGYETDPPNSPTLCLSRVYCELGDGEKALEWIDRAFEFAGPVAFDTPFLLSQRAEALVLQGHLDEAEEYLDLSHKVSLKSGRTGHLATKGVADGYFELAQGNPLAAIDAMEPCFDHLIQMPVSIYINRLLIALARAENAANASGLAEISDKWLTKLGQYAEEKKLPGILMIHALLKAESLATQGHTESALSILEKALSLEESPSLRTLIERIQAKMSELKMVRL